MAVAKAIDPFQAFHRETKKSKQQLQPCDPCKIHPLQDVLGSFRNIHELRTICFNFEEQQPHNTEWIAGFGEKGLSLRNIVSRKNS